MPNLRGVTVHITDSHGDNLREWGIRHLRHGAGGKKVSAYVQSTTDVAFQVSLQPTIPFIEGFPPPDTLGDKTYVTKKKTRHSTASLEDLSTKQNHEKKNSDALSSPVRSSTTSQDHPTPDFAFLAVLYLDGRNLPERKIIVYTDPTDKDFTPPNGKVALKHRWVQSADGGISEHAWVFKEKAIETAFDRLMIAGTQDNVEDPDNDALIKAMESSRFDDQEKTEKECKVGQIVVELHRVVLGEKRIEANYRPRHREGQEEDVDMEGAPRDVSHATGLIHKNTLKSQPIKVVEHWPYQRNEGPYSTFQFFYRSREQLLRFHFPGFESLLATKPARTTRALNARMANLTPLSISLPLDKKTEKVQCDQDSYEAKVGRRALKPDDSPKYDFGSEYRDLRAKSPCAVDKAHETEKSAALLLSKANKLAENVNVGPFSPKTGQSSAEARRPTERPLCSELEFNPQALGDGRQTLNSDTPTLITAKSSPSVPPPTESTKDQAANITDKAEYRPNARDPHPGDQEEEDTDYDCATESDLETRADDDDFDYTVDPEDEGYGSLQSRFKDVKIRKRQRDDDESAEDDGEAWPGAVADTAESDGGREQKSPRVPLTDEERLQHAGKKSKTAKRRLVANGRQDIQGTGGGVLEHVPGAVAKKKATRGK